MTSKTHFLFPVSGLKFKNRRKHTHFRQYVRPSLPTPILDRIQNSFEHDMYIRCVVGLGTSSIFSQLVTLHSPLSQLSQLISNHLKSSQKYLKSSHKQREVGASQVELNSPPFLENEGIVPK